MKTRWRVLLILVAVVCFAIALSYPLKYSMQKKDAEAGMERLVELRNEGLAKRGERDDGRMSASSTEETEEEGAEKSELPADRGQSEGFAPSDLQEESASENAEPEADAELMPEAPVEVRTEAAMEPATNEELEEEPETAVEAAVIRESENAEEIEQTLEQASAPDAAEATQEPAIEAVSEQSVEATQEPATEAESEQSVEAAQEPATEAVPEQSVEATQESMTEAEPEQSAAETQELPSVAEEAEVQEGVEQAQESSTQQDEIRVKSSENAQVLPGSGNTEAPAPTSTPTPTPAPTDTPEPTPTVNRFERSGAVPYDQKTKRTLDVDHILPQFQEIYAENKDFAGWIEIPGTDVDYPVVQAEDSDYYLHHDFFGEENVNGQIILDTKCDPYTPSYNLVVSGHNMRSGMMFGNLKSYADEDYWKAHKLVYFDTLMDERTYVIFAAFYSADYDVDEAGFRYNADIQYSVDAKQWLREVEENQLYDTGIDVQFGDEFLTLTTCNKARRSDGRFVVVCRKLREGEEIG